MHVVKAIAMAASIMLMHPESTGVDQPLPIKEIAEVIVETTAKVETSITGISTWYDATRNHAWFTEKPRVGAKARNQDGAPYQFYAAAGPLLRSIRPFKWGGEPYRVAVMNLRNGREIIVTVVDVCQCREGKHEKLIDLAPEAFLALIGDAGLGAGVMRVRVTILEEAQ